MLCLLLGVLAALPTLYLTNLLAAKTVSVRHPRLFALLALLVMLFCWALNNLILPVYCSLLDTAAYIFSIVLISIFARPGSRVKAMVTMTVFFAASFVFIYMGCALFFLACSKAGVDPSPFLRNTTPQYVVLTLTMNLLVVPVLLGVQAILRRIFHSMKESLSLLWLLAIPLSQVVLIADSNRLYFPRLDSRSASAGLLAVTLLCIAADAACLMSFQSLRRMQQLTDQMRQAEEQLNIQTKYYRKLQENILSVNKIRHDLGNQLKSAYYLLEQGHPEEVRQQLDLLKASLDRPVGARYCENLMVDAVLTEKARSCREKGIALALSATVPAELTIENAHLCSAFSCLLDNGIHTALASGVPEKAISLSSRIQDGALLIQCTGPAEAGHGSSASPRELDILRQLAAMYRGKLQTRYREGRFTALLCLSLS